jgi:hypothetical protein
LSIRLFLVLQAFSGFPGSALANPVSYTRRLHGRLSPFFPPSRNFLFEFVPATPAVAIPNARQFRVQAATASEYSFIHADTPNPE